MKKIFLALLSASMVLFAACQQGPSVKVSDDAQVLEYKPSTYDITVESEGSWTLQGSYDWITASKTSGNSGETISFTTTLNTTGLIRTADFVLVSNGDETTVTLYQKSGTLDAMFDLSVLSQGLGTIELAVNLSTNNSDDYKEFGVYYGTSTDFSAAQRKAISTDLSAGTKEVELTGLNPDADYFVWAYVASLVGDEVVSDMLGVLPPVFVDASVTDLQTVIDNARPYSEVRILAGKVFEGNFKAKSNVKISGGWNADFTEQSTKLEDYTVLDAHNSGTVLVIDRAVEGFEMNRIKIANGVSMDGAGLQIDGKATIVNCWFDNNYATHRGGAIGSTPDGGLNPGESVYTVANSVFTRNGGVEHGTCVCVDYNCNATFVNNLLYDNYGVTLNDYWHTIITYAGGVFVNNTIVANIMTFGKTDYAIFGAREDHANRATYPLVFVNNMIVGNNVAPKGEGRLQPNEYPVPTMRSGRAVDICSYYSRAEDVFENNLFESVAEKVFNAAANTVMAPTDFSYTYPDLFKDYANDDYSLVSGASAVNTGKTINSTVDALLKKYNKDLAGNPRVAGGFVDLGCYELQ